MQPSVSFNSIKVQLEHDGEVAGHSRFGFQFHKGAIRTPATLDASGKVTLFQFHKGSIRTVAPTGPRANASARFNSIKVQLEPELLVQVLHIE